MTNVRWEGMDAMEAVREAVATRLRPIAMSTLTTVFGLAPLVFLAGEGTELYRGVGVIVMFGLLGTAVVTLTFLPALIVLFLKLTRHRAITPAAFLIPFPLPVREGTITSICEQVSLPDRERVRVMYPKTSIIRPRRPFLSPLP